MKDAPIQSIVVGNSNFTHEGSSRLEKDRFPDAEAFQHFGLRKEDHTELYTSRSDLFHFVSEFSKAFLNNDANVYDLGYTDLLLESKFTVRFVCKRVKSVLAVQQFAKHLNSILVDLAAVSIVSSKTGMKG